jgi:uncharacterized protein YqjF (DUF2071 family)
MKRLKDFPAGVTREVAHRPWPLPRSPWVMTQSWHDLLFAHWPVDRALLASRVPSVLAIDAFDGQAWLGIVPFSMTNVGVRWLGNVGRYSHFPELNVRTYVTVDGKPGVFFFSLDAGSAAAVRVARTALCLPYFPASMSVRCDGDAIHYRSQRCEGSPPASFFASYRPVAPAALPRTGTLEHFLTERYCLYALNRRGKPYRLEIHHAPWLLQPAAADIEVNTMAAAAGIALPGAPPLLHFATRQDAVAWLPRRV